MNKVLQGPRGRIVAGGMLREGTPIQDHREKWGLWVKREDLACPPPGPPFSKARGVYARVASRKESLIGVLDTRHSQAGHAVARACQVLGKRCVNYYPELKYEPGPREPQLRARSLGAELVGLPAGRSAILYHTAKKQTEARGGYMMSNALKLEESVAETAKEVPRGFEFEEGDVPAWVLIPVSSGTIAAGVIKGFGDTTDFILHLGYSRSHDQVRRYVEEQSGIHGIGCRLVIIDEGYAYADVSRSGPEPEWPCNEYYDLKAFRWWVVNGGAGGGYGGDCLLWNVG